MRLNRIGKLAAIAVLVAGCGVGGSGGGSSTPAVISTVSSTQLVAITVAPAAASVPTGTSKQYTATGEFGDGSTKVITAAVTWHSSSEDIATVNASGLVSAISQTTATTMIMAKSGTVSGSAILTVTGGIVAPAANVLPITVNGSLCSAGSYLNKPCVSITICTPGNPASCKPINDIILDTGSFGLRIFKQALPSGVTPVQISSGPGSLAECAQFGDGTSLWGPVQTADAILGNEPAIQVPIQVIDSTFGTVPAFCTNPEQSPLTAGFNGILGVGVFNYDCGSVCTGQPSGTQWPYYSCTGPTCNTSSAPLANQVQNPVASLPTDSNGVIVELQSVPLNGLPSANGILVLGIGTKTNNTPPAGVTVYNADVLVGEIRTTFNGNLYGSIIDSGSNGLFFPPPSTSMLPDCPLNTGWFCPAASTVILSAKNAGSSGSPSNDIFFQIGNLNNLTNSSNRVFSNIGGSTPGMFDWGLPAYLGRDIYVGIDTKSSSLGSGPFFAY